MSTLYIGLGGALDRRVLLTANGDDLMMTGLVRRTEETGVCSSMFSESGRRFSKSSYTRSGVGDREVLSGLGMWRSSRRLSNMAYGFSGTGGASRSTSVLYSADSNEGCLLDLSKNRVS